MSYPKCNAQIMRSSVTCANVASCTLLTTSAWVASTNAFSPDCIGQLVTVASGTGTVSATTVVDAVVGPSINATTGVKTYRVHLTEVPTGAGTATLAFSANVPAGSGTVAVVLPTAPIDCLGAKAVYFWFRGADTGQMSAAPTLQVSQTPFVDDPVTVPAWVDVGGVSVPGGNLMQFAGTVHSVALQNGGRIGSSSQAAVNAPPNSAWRYCRLKVSGIATAFALNGLSVYGFAMIDDAGGALAGDILSTVYTPPAGGA